MHLLVKLFLRHTADWLSVTSSGSRCYSALRGYPAFKANLVATLIPYPSKLRLHCRFLESFISQQRSFKA
jgi:hypothetical protein